MRHLILFILMCRDLPLFQVGEGLVILLYLSMIIHGTHSFTCDIIALSYSMFYVILSKW